MLAIEPADIETSISSAAMAQTSEPQTSLPQTSADPIVLLNPWGGLKQFADLTYDLDAMVVWQLERHIHWAGPRTPWTSYDEIHQVLDIRTAHELRDSHLMGRGNMGLWDQHVWYQPDPPSRDRDLPWGKPAAALASYGQRFPITLPKGWLWTIRMRMLLLPLEIWYFNFPSKRRDGLGLDLVRWPLPNGLRQAIDEAFDSFI